MQIYTPKIVHNLSIRSNEMEENPALFAYFKAENFVARNLLCNFAAKYANFSMKKILLITTTLLLSLCTFITAQAQDNGTDTPYSRYGLGKLSNQAQGFNQGMAGLAQGMRGGNELNFKNAASYSAIDSLSFLFDIGMSVQNGNFSSGNVATNARNASFDYLSMGFRLHKGLGMSLGVMPINSVGYKITGKGDSFDGGITGDVTPSSYYNGQGGLHDAYIGLGYAPTFNRHKNYAPLSLGVNVGFLWGNFSHSITNTYSNNTIDSHNRVYGNELHSYKVDVAMQWKQKVNAKNSFVLGLSYNLGHDLAGTVYCNNDTIKGQKAWSLPHSISAGLTWNYNNHLRVGVDYSLEKWSQAKQPVLVNDKYTVAQTGYKDAQHFTVGMEYIQDPRGLKWRNRIRYRAGFSYGTSYIMIGDQNGPRSYLASVGAALPIINIYNNRTFLNVSAQYECIKPQVPGQIKENYLRLCLGISFNERWFQKWKVE